MTTLEKLVDVNVTDVISIPLAVILVSWFTGGISVAVVIGNRLWSLIK